MLNKPEFREVPHEKGYPDSQQRIERDEAIDFNEGLKAGLAYYEQELARAEGLSRGKIERAVCKATGWLKHEMRTEDYEFTDRIVDAIIAAKRGEK